MTRPTCCGARRHDAQSRGSLSECLSRKGGQMRKFHLFGIAMTLFALAVVTGCGNQQGGTPKGGTPKGDDKAAKKGGDGDHDHGPGPHGGTIIEFGKWHGEFTVNHKTQEATVY